MMPARPAPTAANSLDPSIDRKRHEDRFTATGAEKGTEILANIHANCVAINNQGLLLLGPSGAGKSDLSLRLMDRGAILVADDRCDIRYDGTSLCASAPDTLAGLMEVRGLGILAQPYQKNVALTLAVELVTGYDRYPLDSQTMVIADHPLPLLRLNPFEMSAPLKIMLALQSYGCRQ